LLIPFINKVYQFDTLIYCRDFSVHVHVKEVFHCYIQLKRKGINAYIFYLWNIEGAVFSIA
jgi:hypothetical protein